jgi:hypothetical protein
MEFRKLDACCREDRVDKAEESDPDLDLARVQRVVRVGHGVRHDEADGVMNILRKGPFLATT